MEEGTWRADGAWECRVKAYRRGLCERRSRELAWDGSPEDLAPPARVCRAAWLWQGAGAMAESLTRIRLPSAEEGALTAVCVAWLAMHMCRPSGCPGSAKSQHPPLPSGGSAFVQGASGRPYPRAAPVVPPAQAQPCWRSGGIFRGQPRSCESPGWRGRREVCCLPGCCQGKAWGT